MKQLACRYAIVQFVPYMETGEFANVGIVLACPSAGTFGFSLQARKYARVTAFFPEVRAALYRNAVTGIEAELKRVRDTFDRLEGSARADAVRQAFTQLVHPREAMIRFSAPRVVLTDSPADELKRLFEHYVNHSFADHEYIETTMTKRLQSLLSGLNLTAPFRPAKLGDDVVHANFQLVQKHEGTPQKVIKAFNLNQADPNSIYAHGDIWVPKIRRLRDRRLLPKQTMFTVDLPPVIDEKRFAASQEILDGLREQDVIIVPNSEDAAIKDFALGR